MKPAANIPEHEIWLYQNFEALKSVLQGLQEAASGRVHDAGSFAEFADLEIDDV